MNNKELIEAKLTELHLSSDEARLYIELCIKPNTHLQLARITGINRTRVYRLIDQLEKRSLVSRRTDDRGMFLVASDPSALEISLVTDEERIRAKREIFEELMPSLKALASGPSSPFTIHTYEGIEGFKQMQWHELKTKGEVLVFGNVTVEQLVGSHRWAEKFRDRSVAKGYGVREIFNRRYEKPNFTKNPAFMNLYEARLVSEEELPTKTPIIIYNDTVAIYQFVDEKRVGVEIINAAFAQTMRQIFTHYWRTAEPMEPPIVKA